MRRASSLLLVSLALSACKGELVEQGVLVTVDNKSGVTAIVQLLVRAINQDSSEVFPLPEMPQSTPLSFPTQFSISLPSTRNGRVDIVIDGLNPLAIPVASGTGFAVLQGSAFVGASVDLLPVAIPPGTGGAGGPAGTGGAVGSGGIAGVGGALFGVGGALGVGGIVESGGIVGAGGIVGTGGIVDTGGAVRTGGVIGTGGTSDGTVAGGTVGSGGTIGSGGRAGTGGVVESGGVVGTGGTVQTGGVTGAAGVAGTGGMSAGGSAGSAGACTASINAGKSVLGSGPHKVVIETNSDPGIMCGTIFRPADLGGTQRYPIFVWGEGGCSQSGLSNQGAMGEIASWGYFIVADGVASGTACSGGQDGKALLDYITWAIAENDKPCSAYYQSLDTAKIAADGFSCGGLMAENASGDPRFTAIGITSSGSFSADQALYAKIHTPFKILLGGSGDVAYSNGERDYDNISALGIPILLFSKEGAGHGGDLSNAKGDFNTVNLAWLNWQLKGDEGATGKGLLIGSSCKYCNASGWEFKSANIQ